MIFQLTHILKYFFLFLFTHFNNTFNSTIDVIQNQGTMARRNERIRFGDVQCRSRSHNRKNARTWKANSGLFGFVERSDDDYYTLGHLVSDFYETKLNIIKLIYFMMVIMNQ